MYPIKLSLYHQVYLFDDLFLMILCNRVKIKKRPIFFGRFSSLSSVRFFQKIFQGRIKSGVFG